METLNKTDKYYLNHPIDLMTEYTICESLSSVKSPYMLAVESPRPYGAIIGDALLSCDLLTRGCRICEIGGGYGSLMRGLLDAHSSIIHHVYMADISMDLLKKQKRILKPWDNLTTFINADAIELVSIISHVDAMIVNEVIGDLDTWKDIDAISLPPDVSRLVHQYSLEIPAAETFNFNIGAILLVENICKKGIPIFICEHSSDPIIPDDMAYLERGLNVYGFPREIRLRGHSEFTIRFSHLIKVAGYWGRKVLTGSLIDLVGLKRSPMMKFIFTAHACATEEHEIIYELLDHIREYRWLIIA